MFEKTLDDNMDVFVYSGVFLAVEKLRLLTLRNLIKKVAMAQEQDPSISENYSSQPNVIQLDVLLGNLIDWDPDLDLDELECLLSTQIFNGMIRGYLNHEKRILVLGKVDTFPLKKAD